MRKALVLIGTLALLGGAQARAGGETGNSGHSVVCFSIAASEAVDHKGLITQEGRKSIVSASLYEAYKIGETAAASQFARKIQSESYEAALSTIHEVFTGVPDFKKQLEEARRILGRVDQAIPATGGLIRVYDSGTDFGLPENCAIVQTVIRQLDVLSYDPGVYAQLPAAQQALLQLHEELYYLGSLAHQKDGIATQLLIMKLLLRDYDPKALESMLKDLGFVITPSVLANPIASARYTGPPRYSRARVVACFSIAFDEATEGSGLLTPAGRKAIVSVESLDSARVRDLPTQPPLVTALKGQDYTSASTGLRDEFLKVPYFRKDLLRVFAKQGLISEGIPAANGFKEEYYGIEQIGLPKHCGMLTPFIKQKGTVFCDSLLWSRLSGFEQAVLQLRAELEEYVIRTWMNNAEDRLEDESIDALMLTLLSRPMSERDWAAKLKSYGAGEWPR